MKRVTIKSRKQFRRIYNKGKSFVSPELVTYVLKNRTGEKKYGITTSKKIGNAVKRNRARRIIRAAYNNLCGSIAPGYDFIFVARTKTVFLKSTDIEPVMRKHLEKAGVMESTLL